MDATLLETARRTLEAERDRLREELAVEIEGPGVAPRTQNVVVRTVRSIQARLSKKADAAQAPRLRSYTPGWTRFLDLEIEGEENNFVERTIRIRRIAEPRASQVRAEILASIPAKRGRVT